MGRRSAAFLLVLACVTVCSGCLVAPFRPPQGIVVDVQKAPLDLQYDRTVPGPKRGESSAHNILFLVAWGDLSTQTAAKAGGITRITHADYTHLNILYIWQRTTVIVYGE